MITLKDAQKDGKLDRFIRERKDQPPGDMALLENALASMTATAKEATTETPTEAPGASPQVPSYD